MVDHVETQTGNLPGEKAEEIAQENAASAEEAKVQQAESKPTEPDAALETKKALKGVQKRIDELTRQRYEAEEAGRQQAEYWRQQALALQQQHEALKSKVGPPKSDQFPDYEQYLAALAAHEATRIADERIAQERQIAMERSQREAQARYAQQAQQAYMAEVESKVADAIKKFPDFVDVVTSPELPGLQGTPAFGAIMESDLGAEVMYYLGKNPAKAHHIVSLSHLSQVREIGRIEASLAAGKTVSNAPEPASTVDGKSGGATKDPARMDYDEFVAYRRKQIAARR